MIAIKLQAYNSDTVPNVDQRGAEPGYAHSTLAESDPAPDDLVAQVLLLGPSLNEMLRNLVPSLPGVGHLSVGVFVMDGDGRE